MKFALNVTILAVGFGCTIIFLQENPVGFYDPNKEIDESGYIFINWNTEDYPSLAPMVDDFLGDGKVTYTERSKFHDELAKLKADKDKLERDEARAVLLETIQGMKR